MLAIFSLTLTACTSKQLYQAGQGHERGECINNATSGAEIERCQNAEKKSFEEYEKEREKIINKCQ